MPQPQEKIPEPTELPNPELNPLLNPTLGKNLGRWAQVYFTTPPEKREQAVLELLRELQGQVGPGDDEPSNEVQAPAWLRQLEEASLPPAKLHCAECGHENAKEQRFCGMCGSLLTLDEVSAPRLQERSEVPPAVLDEIRSTSISGPRSTAETVPTSLFEVELPQANTAPTIEPELPKEPVEIHWLRDKNLTDSGPLRLRAGAKYGIALFAVFVVAVLFYAQSRSQGTGSTGPIRPQDIPSLRATAPAPPRPAPAATAAPVPPPASSSNAAGNANKPSVVIPAGVGELPATRPAHASEMTQNASAALPGNVPIGPGSGSAELATAEEYLSGKNGARDSASAAKFLWKAVAKENVTATILLSDLYRTGDGVPKSCDQARVLLDAAAQKNSTQAASKLRELQTSGCQ